MSRPRPTVASDSKPAAVTDQLPESKRDVLGPVRGFGREIAVGVIVAVVGTVATIFVTRWIESPDASGDLVIQHTQRGITRRMFYAERRVPPRPSWTASQSR